MTAQSIPSNRIVPEDQSQWVVHFHPDANPTTVPMAFPADITLEEVISVAIAAGDGTKVLLDQGTYARHMGIVCYGEFIPYKQIRGCE